MSRPPRRSDEAILPGRLMAWMAVIGLVMGVSTLAIISWANDPHGLVVARTMGFTAFCIAHVVFAVTTKDERRTMFNLDTFADKPLLISIGASAAVIVLTVTFGPLQRLLQTADLELEQWLVCLGVGAVIIVVSELRKLLFKHILDDEPLDAADAARSAVSTPPAPTPAAAARPTIDLR